MQTEKILLVTTVLAAAALAKYRMADFSGNPASAGERVLGVPVTNFDAGELAGVATSGELLVEAGAAIAVGAQVESDALGRAITLAAGVPFGVARTSAAAAGDIITVLVR